MSAPNPSPFLRLPAELRVQIYEYLLPTTTRISYKHDNGLVWLRGCTPLWAVNRQISEECLALLYGHNTFVIEIAYSRLDFRLRWLLPDSGLTPNRAFSFLDHFSQRNLQRIRKCLVHVEMVDSYTGMIKYNCGGRGLQAGLREQIRRLVEVLRSAGELRRVEVRFVDKQKNARATQAVLEPLLLLRGVREAVVSGGVTPDYADYLERKMVESGERPVMSHRPRIPFMPEQRRSAPPLLEKILLAS
ncbi:hypothetical protein GTA08_BOTSDO08930 [Neofusicoccum parvum]|uniref:Uncharacterized protein n=1 Tax=Neofusicoccum parvum TaxID=310453 RepID=A0ACB5SJ72_9PEZI|nr:hypothetical protein GTA08_BOTSDO08930 [Neofusicoccum parvum]GME53486.1 hypothetical protein GTA08_BOTSDO08930 [Neofusicoccum parvum]